MVQITLVSERNCRNIFAFHRQAGSLLLTIALSVFCMQAVTAVKPVSLENFKNDGVVPEVINEVPPKLLQVQYGSIDVLPGMILTPAWVKDPPTVEYQGEDGAYYTLIMLDPDAPSRMNPVSREWQHWLVTNIPGSDIKQGQENTEYVGAGPPKGTGLHRYVFLLYKQPQGKMKFKGLPKLTNHSGMGRAGYNVQRFIATYGLEGNLVAGNFFKAKYDDYVPTLYKQLTG
ncbi:hypothetical protein CHS0354_004482 [Potamilus streckersoni]|uniref:Phosphatidylethanolamine-binding protein n=1 Tax=Potamilus streckersoni TaxID=2493646 RepID=A0AAE0SNH8_9BIVA|nr:hypothetical protein CHS0354_004482 [Potamilus streckersoni]